MEHQPRDVACAVSRSQHQQFGILRILEKQGVEEALQYNRRRCKRVSGSLGRDDADTLEWVWQSLFKTYNRALRELWGGGREISRLSTPGQEKAR